MAVRLEIPENQALAGIVWYNNDENITFPTISIGTGFESGPGLITEMAVLAENGMGQSSAWSELSFSEPVVASLGQLYLVFEFPEGTPFAGEGLNGGPAIGYCSGLEGTPGWISGDGETWMRLHEEAGIALRTSLVPIQDGMLVKSLDPEEGGMEVPVMRPYLQAGPNPFNPMTELKFGLAQSTKTTIDVFDLRGRRVIRLVNDFMEAGHHSVRWTGVDDKGHRVASGPYFVRLLGPAEPLVNRVMLIK